MANRPITNRELVAWEFAKEKHSGQIRKFLNISYFDGHVQKVNGIVKQYTVDEDILIASLLHDVIEDCYENRWIGYSEIKLTFGSRVADIVMELTSDNNEIDYKYNGDKAQYLINKMRNMSPMALTIKLADRLQNISDAFTASESFRNKYFDETSKIVLSLASVPMNSESRKILCNIESKIKNIQSIFKINQ